VQLVGFIINKLHKLQSLQSLYALLDLVRIILLITGSQAVEEYNTQKWEVCVSKFDESP